MSTAATNSTGLASSILRFLKDELSSDDVTPDKAESLEVAIQCLRLAYDTDEITELDEPKLLDIYTNAVSHKGPKPVSDEAKLEAEVLKKLGNESMKNEDYNAAIESYTQAIKADPCNAVYYCNRAAAHTGVNQLESALGDCKKAIKIDSNYSKAYSRMGLTYSKLEKYELAVECYEKALKLDPTNEGYKNNMQIAKDKAKSMTEAPAVNIPGMGGMGMGGFAEMMNNPALMNMAQRVMGDPAMQQMAMSMMGNFMGGGGPGQPGQQDNGDESQPQPNMAEMLQMGQQFAAQVSQDHPEVIENLRNQMNTDTEQSPDNTNPEQ